MRVTKFGTEISQDGYYGEHDYTWIVQNYGALSFPHYYRFIIRSRNPSGYIAQCFYDLTSTLSTMLSTANLGTPELTVAYPGGTATLATWWWNGSAIATAQIAGVSDSQSLAVYGDDGPDASSASTYLDNTVVQCTTGDIAVTWGSTADLTTHWQSSYGDVISGRLRTKWQPDLFGYYRAYLLLSEIVVPCRGGCVLVSPPGKPFWLYRIYDSGITEAAGGLFGQVDPLEAGQTNILTGSSYGLCHAWMTDQGHRALVYEHSGNLSAALWDGDWEHMLVKDARTKPWAIRLEPSNDVWIPCIDGSNNLKIDRLVWDGSVSTYSVSTTELDTGIDAKDVGGMWIEPNGEVGLAYVNMSDQLAIATGDLSGGSWVL